MYLYVSSSLKSNLQTKFTFKRFYFFCILLKFILTADHVKIVFKYQEGLKKGVSSSNRFQSSNILRLLARDLLDFMFTVLIYIDYAAWIFLISTIKLRRHEAIFFRSKVLRQQNYYEIIRGSSESWNLHWSSWIYFLLIVFLPREKKKESERKRNVCVCVCVFLSVRVNLVREYLSLWQLKYNYVKSTLWGHPNLVSRDNEPTGRW